MTERAIPASARQILRTLVEMTFAAVSGTSRAARQDPQNGGAVLAKKEKKMRHFGFGRGGYRAVGGDDIGSSDLYGRIGRTDIYSSQEAFDLYRKMAFDKNPPF